LVFLKGPRITQLLPIGQTGNEDREEFGSGKRRSLFSLFSSIKKSLCGARQVVARHPRESSFDPSSSSRIRAIRD
jgi:hypothetical protein